MTLNTEFLKSCSASFTHINYLGNIVVCLHMFFTNSFLFLLFLRIITKTTDESRTSHRRVKTSHRRLQMNYRRVTDGSQTTTDELQTSHRRVINDYRQLQTSHRRVTKDYRRVTDESQTTTDESQTSHKRLQTSHRRVIDDYRRVTDEYRRVTDNYDESFREFYWIHYFEKGYGFQVPLRKGGFYLKKESLRFDVY